MNFLPMDEVKKLAMYCLVKFVSSLQI